MYLVVYCQKLIFTGISDYDLIWNYALCICEPRGSGISLKWTLILMAAILEVSPVTPWRDSGEHHELLETKTVYM